MDPEYAPSPAFFLAYFVFMAAFYVYFSYALMVIAKKTGQTELWMAWVPLIQIILMCKIADKPLWWTAVLILVPCVNIILFVMLWMAIAEKRGKPAWVGLLFIVPIVGFAIPGYLAFSD